MLRRVKIKAVPKARTGYQVQGSLANDISAWGGGNYAAQSGLPDPEVRQTLTKVPRNEANLEAEGGETAVVNTGNIPAFYKIEGARHTHGGVPLKLPLESFIFSDTSSMKIKDAAVLKRFGLSPKKGGYTPAEISKKFGLNEYIKILKDPLSDKIARKTAELMIKNAVIKLGDLALVQESKKGFEQGIPKIAEPALAAKGISKEELLPQEEQQEMPQQMPNGAPVAMPQEMPQMSPEMMQGAPMAAYGMEMGGFYPEYAFGGAPMYAPGGIITPYEQAKTRQGNVTPTGTSNKFSARQQSLDDYLGQWEANIPGVRDMSEGQAQKAIYDWSLQNNPDAIRNMWTTHGLTAKGMKSNTLRGLSQDRSGKFTSDMLQDQNVLQQLEDAYVDNYFGVRQLDPTKPQPQPQPQPQTEGTPEPNPEVKPVSQDTCTCTDPETGKEVTWALQEGEECDCPGEDTGDVAVDSMNKPVKKTGPWLQDVMGLSGAAIDQYSIPKILPQRTDVDLVKPNLVTYDPTALYNQVAGGKYFGEFAGDPRAASARQSQLVGQIANQFAGIASDYDTKNQQAGQQHEYVTNEIENRERTMDAQAEQMYNDRMAVAKQQYSDAFRKGRGNKRMAAQNLLTNWSKTDALNQMYPNYQVDPTTGGFVDYTPTDKNVDPGKAAMDATTYAQSLEAAGLTEKAQEMLLKQYLGQARFGGTTFKDGGFVYSVFPIVTF
jgi:hypothetical protein